jgi:hypothetical protein
LSSSLPRLYRVSLAVLVLSGAYLARGVLQSAPGEGRSASLGWLEVSVVAFVFFVAAGAVVYRRLRAIWAHLEGADDTTVASPFGRVADPLLLMSFIVRLVTAIVIVFLMMARPPFDVSLLVVAVGAPAAVAYSISRVRRDIGVRMARGARLLDVLRLTIGSGWRRSG